MELIIFKHFLKRFGKNKLTFIRLAICSSFLTIAYILYVHLMQILDNITIHSNKKSSDTKNFNIVPSEFYKFNPVVDGWGEDGEPVQLNDTEQLIADKQFHLAAFNVYVSDRISPNRTLPDMRTDECANVQYNLNKIGQASIIIIYTNEIWSALIRTIWSVINRSPKQLLKEIILVDDFSDKPELKESLDNYIKYYFSDIVKIIRLEKRKGLIQARLTGAKMAQGDVLIFLDSHCEATKGWLEPLMKTISDDYRNVVCPVIDIISDKNLEYVVGNKYYFQVGGFLWTGHFAWIDVNEEQLRRKPTEVVKSPTMAGGLFAINRKHFFDIGSYDEKMEIWGGENLELSFRIWQCGSRLYIHPCSHVGHIFRDYHPYSFLGKDSHGLNTLRTVMVWMDEYSRYFFMHRIDMKNKPKYIDVSERLQLRKRLGCKSFSWYLKNVYDGKKFIYDQNVTAYGNIRNPITNLCIDNLNRDEVSKHEAGVYQCIENDLSEWTNQMFSMMTSGEIRREEGCLAIDESTNHKVIIRPCIDINRLSRSRKRKARLRKLFQTWKHHRGGMIMNEHTNLCLTTESLKSSNDLRAVECNADDFYQIWWFKKYTNIDL